MRFIEAVYGISAGLVFGVYQCVMMDSFNFFKSQGFIQNQAIIFFMMLSALHTYLIIYLIEFQQWKTIRRLITIRANFLILYIMVLYIISNEPKESWTIVRKIMKYLWIFLEIIIGLILALYVRFESFEVDDEAFLNWLAQGATTLDGNNVNIRARRKNRG